MDVREMMMLADAGLLKGRFELVDGELIEMPPQGNAHSNAVSRLVYCFVPAWPQPKAIRSQSTHRFTAHDTPEPDFCLLDREAVPNALVDELPRLIVEVSESTLAVDLGRKKVDYARFGVPEYWVLDLIGRRLFVFRDPAADADDAVHAWRDEQILLVDAVISPLCLPDLAVKVANLLPDAGTTVPR